MAATSRPLTMVAHCWLWSVSAEIAMAARSLLARVDLADRGHRVLDLDGSGEEEARRVVEDCCRARRRSATRVLRLGLVRLPSVWRRALRHPSARPSVAPPPSGRCTHIFRLPGSSSSAACLPRLPLAAGPFRPAHIRGEIISPP
jgi:hypothetical protein